MKKLASYLTTKSESDPQFSPAKLNWLLFYCDFTAYRRLGRSITGCIYQKLPSGPAPKAGQGAFDSIDLSSDEFSIADQIFEVLVKSRDGNLSEQLSGFLGWLLADNNEVIPYEVVFLGDPLTPVSEDEVEFCKLLERDT